MRLTNGCCLLFLISHLAWAETDPEYNHEFNFNVGGGVVHGIDAGIREIDDMIVTSGFEFNLDAGFTEFIVDSDFTYLRLNDENHFQIEASTSFLYMALYELLYRSGPGNTDRSRWMFGSHNRFEIAEKHAWIDLSFGAYHAKWDDPSDQLFPKQDRWGGYAGAQLTLKIWKFENKLRAAYVMAFNNDRQIPEEIEFAEGHAAKLGEGDQKAYRKFATLADPEHGYTITDELYFDAFEFSYLDMGPEIRFRWDHLPDAKEVLVTIGFQGTIDF